MATVRMCLHTVGTGKELIVRGETPDALMAAENFRAVMQESLLPARRQLRVEFDPKRPPFFRPEVRSTPQGAEMVLVRPDVLDEKVFGDAVSAAVDRFRMIFPFPLLVN